RRAALRVAGRRVGQHVAGDDDVAPQQRVTPAVLTRRAVRRIVDPLCARQELRADRRAAPRRRVEDVVLDVDEPELERRRRAEHALGLRRILDTRKLHENAVEALALHDGLGDAELVDTATQRDRVLLDREVLPLADHRLGRPYTEPRPAADLRALDD